VSLFLEVLEFNPDGSQSPSGGTTICQISGNDPSCGVSPDNCVTTNVDGKAVLDLAANREVVYTLDKDGYSPIVHGRVTDETFSGMAGGPMVPHEQGEALAAQLGTPYPWKGGIVTLLRLPTGQAGVTFQPVGSTIDEVGEAFYYDTETDRYSVDIDATTAPARPATFALAEGGFTEVIPGEQQFEFGGMAGDCPEQSHGLPGNGPNQIRVPVLEGHISYASLRCQ
jgi:hypothetical protein